MEIAGGPWSFPSEFGTPFLTGELSTGDRPPPPHRPRKSERVPIELGAGLRQRGGSGVPVEILDLSTEGFRAATHLCLEPGAVVWLRLPGLEACQARVAWARGQNIGCAFDRPLHPAVLDMIVGRTRNG